MSFLLPLSFQICPKTPESPNENELMTSYGFYTTPLANAITHNCVKASLNTSLTTTKKISLEKRTTLKYFFVFITKTITLSFRRFLTGWNEK